MFVSPLSTSAAASRSALETSTSPLTASIKESAVRSSTRISNGRSSIVAIITRLGSAHQSAIDECSARGGGTLVVDIHDFGQAHQFEQPHLRSLQPLDRDVTAIPLSTLVSGDEHTHGGGIHERHAREIERHGLAGMLVEQLAQ